MLVSRTTVLFRVCYYISISSAPFRYVHSVFEQQKGKKEEPLDRRKPRHADFELRGQVAPSSSFNTPSNDSSSQYSSLFHRHAHASRAPAPERRTSPPRPRRELGASSRRLALAAPAATTSSTGACVRCETRSAAGYATPSCDDLPTSFRHDDVGVWFDDGGKGEGGGGDAGGGRAGWRRGD